MEENKLSIEKIRLLKNRDKEKESVITEETIVHTNEFTCLLETNRSYNIECKSVFLFPKEFETLSKDEICNKIDNLFHIGKKYSYSFIDPFIVITFDYVQLQKEGCYTEL